MILTRHTQPSARRAVHSREVEFSPPLLMWGVVLALFPLYLFPKQSPQISDIGMAVLILMVSVSRGYTLLTAARPVLTVFALFGGYVLLISIYRTVQTGATEMMLFATYYVFNLLRFATILRLYARYRERFLRMTLYGVLGALLVLVIISGGSPLSLTGREQLSFNNPNQLGYFALLSISIVYLLTTAIKVRWYVQVFAYLSLVWLGAVSLSKAAMIALGMFGVFAVFRRSLVIVVLGLALLGSYAIADPNVEIIERVQYRFGSLGQHEDDSWDLRGYDRIRNHPEYLIVGAGEGGYDRFESLLPGELHSTLGNLFFSFGVIGGGLFIAGLLLLGRVAGLQASLLLVPVFAYGLSHQGLRFALFWVLLAVMFCVGHARRSIATSRVPAPASLPMQRVTGEQAV
jgi:hypothetical protein